MRGKSSEGQAGDKSDRPGNEDGKRVEEWREDKKKGGGEYLRKRRRRGSLNDQPPHRRI